MANVNTGYVDAATAFVLSNNELLMSAPSNSKLTAFYPTPQESTNTLAQAVCNSGQLFVRANSKRFGSPSNFQVSTANILDAPLLTMKIVIKELDAVQSTQRANTFVGSWQEGWGYDLIQSIEISYSNSNISNLIVTGQALRDWSLLQCKNEDERKDLLRTAGRLQIQNRASTRIFNSTIPLSFLNWQGAGGVAGGFPIDARTLNGSIQFQIRFRELNAAIGPMASQYNPMNVQGDAGTAGTAQYRPGTTFGFPPEFDTLELTFRTYQLMDSAFTVSRALQANPGMIYSMPSKWVNTYNYNVAIKDGVGEQQLNSAPAGMIQAILLSIRPTDDGTGSLDWDGGSTVVDGVSSAKVPHYFSLPLEELRLQYSGQSIFDAKSRDQLEAFYKFIFCDDLITPIAGINQPRNLTTSDAAMVAANINKPDRKGIRWQAPLHMIPLMHNGNNVFRDRHFENLPHYSGSTLSLKFKVLDPLFGAAPYANNEDPTSPTSNETEQPINLDQIFSHNIATQTDTIPGDTDGDPAKLSAVKEIKQVELQVTYVVAALLQSTNGVVELQL